MNKLETFEQYLTTTSAQVPVLGFAFNLILAAVLAYVLSKIYTRYGNSLSNRKAFGSNFILIAMATMVVIAIVKSSLALSLGLVGALSIVRFRTAIKEPEELAYMFLAIVIGLGLGADQRLITIAAFLIISIVIILRNHSQQIYDHQNLYLTVSTKNNDKVKLEEIVETLRNHCTAVDLKRFDQNEETVEASFLIEYDTFEQITETRNQLNKIDGAIKITFMDNKGII